MPHTLLYNDFFFTMLNTCTCSHCFLLAQGLCWFNILSSNSLIGFCTRITWLSFLKASYFFCSIFCFCLTFNVRNVLGLICLSSLSLSLPIASPLQFCVRILSHSYSLSLISPYPPMAFQYNPNADFHKIYISAPNFCLSFWSIHLNCCSSYPLVCLTGISNFMWPKQNSQFSSASLIMSPTLISCPRPNKQVGLFLDFYSSQTAIADQSVSLTASTFKYSWIWICLTRPTVTTLVWAAIFFHRAVLPASIFDLLQCSSTKEPKLLFSSNISWLYLSLVSHWNS